MSYMHSIYDPRKNSIYNPENPEKYVGKHYPIVRSGIEEGFFKLVDRNPNVIE